MSDGDMTTTMLPPVPELEDIDIVVVPALTDLDAARWESFAIEYVCEPASAGTDAIGNDNATVRPRAAK